MLFNAGAVGLLDGLLLLVAGVTATAVCGLRARRTPNNALAWVLLGGAALTEVAARWLWWSNASPGGRLSLPATGEAVHLVATALAAAGVMRMRAHTPDRASTRRTVVDGLTLLVAVLLLVSSAVFTSGDDASGAARGFAAVASCSDVVLAVLGLVVVSCARYPGGFGLRALLPVCAGMVAVAAGDTATTGVALSGDLTAATPTHFLILGGLLLVAAGAMVSDAPDDAAAMSRRERIAVCAAVGPVVLAGLAVAIYQITNGVLSVEITVGVMLLSGLLLCRLIVALLDNLVLSRTLESQVAARTLEIVTREQWFRSLVQHSSDVITVLDPTGVIRYQSPSVERLFGYDPAELVGATLDKFVGGSDVARLQGVLSRATALPGSSYVLEFPVAHRDGTLRETETVVTSLIDVPDVRGLVLNTRDVSERKQLQERLTQQAFYDALTGLANRSLFQHELAACLANAEPGSVAVLFLDLDGFKAVNDSQGHDAGDSLLGIVAERLRRCVRPLDVVARFGGDEFAVLVRDVDAMSSAKEIADRIATSLATPIGLDGREIRIGVSVGIAGVAPQAESVDVLLRNADLAMYRAKADRHESVVVFEPAMHDALLARLAVEDDLRAALGGGQMVLHYQPTVELATGHAVGVEALMRWYRPGRGIVSPNEFIEIAEDNGFIDAMGQWALFEACQQAAEWQQFARPGTVFSVGVNISARQVTPALVDQVAAAVADAGIAPAALLLEMTESVLLGRTEEAIDVLRALKRLGVRLAIDDFGTGFSSLSYLSRFPVDVLKIDKDFIDAVDGAGERGELAQTIVRLGRSLRVATIAEGIERSQQVQALRDMGCEFGQGYLFSRPLPAMGVTELLQLGQPIEAVAHDRLAGVAQPA